MNKFIYLDAAASYLKSNAVIEEQSDFLRNKYANAGRGVCGRASNVDKMVADVRKKIAMRMNANVRNIVFTYGTTDAINRIVRMLNISSDMTVAVSDLDHHSARLPFQMTVANIVQCPLDDKLNMDITRIPFADVMVVTAMSNVMGIPQDVEKIIKAARQKNPNVIVVVDAAQYIVHENIDVQKWDADFVVWSGHKIGADTGIGVMYIKNPNRFMPDKFGGGMVNRVYADGRVELGDGPDVFEAGTLPLTQIAGMGVAIDEINEKRPDLNLIKYLYDKLKELNHIRILTPRDASMLTFVVDNMHAMDFGALVGAHGVCVRVGNMCATWIHQRLQIESSVRVSVGAYNTIEDIDDFVDIVQRIIK